MRPYEKGQGQLNGLILEIDDSSNKVISLQRINLKTSFSDSNKHKLYIRNLIY